jgi:hypothetical protein
MCRAGAAAALISPPDAGRRRWPAALSPGCGALRHLGQASQARHVTCAQAAISSRHTRRIGYICQTPVPDTTQQPLPLLNWRYIHRPGDAAAGVSVVAHRKLDQAVDPECALGPAEVCVLSTIYRADQPPPPHACIQPSPPGWKPRLRQFAQPGYRYVVTNQRSGGLLGIAVAWLFKDLSTALSTAGA